jgi:benzylsuccinate CoA-transferase BbsF subunit
VANSDAVLDNYSVDVMARLGLAYEDLCRAKRDIINLRMPGLGCTGPKRTFSTVGVNITAFTGFTYLWNHPGVTDPPIGAQTVFPDYVSGLLCATIVISGVLYRDRQKKGAFIDLAQSEATAFMIGASMTEAVARDRDAEPIGNASPVAAPHGCYACRGEDRWCVISTETDAQWLALAKIIGGLEADERFRTVEGRLKHREELNNIVEQWTRSRDRYEVMKELQARGIPAGVVQDGADLTADEHLKQRGFIVAVDNERLGRVVLPGFPMRFAEATLTRKWEFPVLGRDSDAVLKEVIGYTDEVIAAHHKNGVLE